MRHPDLVGAMILDAPVVDLDQPVLGREANRIVRELARQRQENREEWPYPWLFPPQNAIRVRQSGTIVAPAAATQTVVLGYEVPAGYAFVMTHILAVFTGSGFVAGSGDITWVLDANVSIGVTAPIGYTVQGFASEVVPLGSFANGPWPLIRPDVYAENDFLRHKVTTTINITPGAPNFFTSMFLGWLLPAAEAHNML